jgi:hypothetical protein
MLLPVVVDPLLVPPAPPTPPPVVPVGWSTTVPQPVAAARRKPKERAVYFDMGTSEKLEAAVRPGRGA